MTYVIQLRVISRDSNDKVRPDLYLASDVSSGGEYYWTEYLNSAEQYQKLSDAEVVINSDNFSKNQVINNVVLPPYIVYRAFALAPEFDGEISWELNVSMVFTRPMVTKSRSLKIRSETELTKAGKSLYQYLFGPYKNSSLGFIGEDAANKRLHVYTYGPWKGEATATWATFPVTWHVNIGHAEAYSEKPKKVDAGIEGPNPRPRPTKVIKKFSFLER